MPAPSVRYKILPARGDISALTAAVAEIAEGELCYALDEDRLYVKEGGVLIPMGGDVTSVAGKTGDVTLVKADITDFSDADYATAAQGATADSATQPGDNVSTLANDAGYITDYTVTSGDVTAHEGDLTIAQSQVTNLTSDLANKADLVGGVVPNSQLPSLAISEYLGTVADQAGLLALSGQRGDWAIRTDTGSTWVITTDGGSNLSDWTELATPADAITSVNGFTGTVVLGPADVGAATAAQGATADSATQPGDNVSTLTNDAGYVTEAPQDGTQYVRNNAAWEAVDVPPGTIVGTSADLPGTVDSGQLWYDTDTGRTFVYTGTEWVDASPDSGYAVATTGDDAPANANDGDLWYRTSDGRMYVYYDDGSTAQWVDANPNLPVGSDTFERSGTTVSLVNSGDTVSLDGDLTVDTNTLHVDSANDRVGIGTDSPSGPLHVQNNDNSPGGVIQIWVADTGTNVRNAQLLAPEIDGTTEPFTFFTSNAWNFRVDSTDALTIDSDTNVGIGTTSPSTKLEVNGNARATTLSIDGTGYYELYLGNPVLAFDANDYILYERTSNYLQYVSGGVERLRIDTFGRATINADNDGLTVNADIATANTGGARGHLLFRRGTNGVLVGSITSTTTATAYNTSSDHRLKENVVEISDGITRLQQLKPSRFNFIANPDTTVDGFLAHEAQTVVPEAVTGTHDEVDDEGNPVYQAIDQSKLVPLLTAALQEAITKIEALEQRLDDAGL